ncbi:hypothetical protein [Streptomyces sp. NPDC050485]|uniref:hypothetical protein n=1 Tax=Streptomyces sp. NPDC050485 TaxID=3365617 RepID=UPI00379AA480
MPAILAAATARGRPPSVGHQARIPRRLALMLGIMEALVLRLSNLDAQAEGALRVVMF